MNRNMLKGKLSYIHIFHILNHLKQDLGNKYEQGTDCFRIRHRNQSVSKHTLQKKIWWTVQTQRIPERIVNVFPLSTKATQLAVIIYAAHEEACRLSTTFSRGNQVQLPASRKYANSSVRPSICSVAIKSWKQPILFPLPILPPIRIQQQFPSMIPLWDCKRFELTHNSDKEKWISG